MKNIEIPLKTWQPSQAMPTISPVRKVEAAPQNWQSIGLLNPVPIRTFTGVNTLDPFAIEDSFATRSKNLSSLSYPALTTRKGYTLLSTALAASIKGMGVWKDTQLTAVSNGIWNKWTGSAWTSIASGFNTSVAWSFCNFKGNYSGITLLAANGIDAMRKYDGTTVSTVSTAPAGANFIEQHDNRAYCAVGSSVYVSSLRNSENWTAPDDSQIFELDNPKGELVTGLRAGAGHIIVFMPTTIYELWGISHKDFRMQIVANDIGLANNNCSINVNGVLYFLDTRRIYRYLGGTAPSDDFAVAVQGYLDQINVAAKDQCCVGTDGSRVYFSIPYQTSTTANVTLVYDTVYEIWNVWQDFSPTCYTRMGNNWYAGDASGRVFQLGNSTTDNGTAIAWEWVSKPFGGDSLAQRIQWHSLWYVADIPSGSTMNVYLSKSASGDADWVLARSLAGNDLQTGKVMIPVGSLGNANWMRVRFTGSGPMTIHEIDRQQREIPLI